MLTEVQVESDGVKIVISLKDLSRFLCRLIPGCTETSRELFPA